MSPQCPYNSALLFHGVGVGKTCAAVTVAENYLAAFPQRSVFIVAPRNIQAGFRRTIFDEEGMKIMEAEGEPNVAKGCTGNSYLQRTGMEFERDPGTIARAVRASLQSRYTILGYIQFQTYIDGILSRIPQGLDEATKTEQQRRLLQREFSGRLVIIDEAHNLRDSPEAEDDDKDVAGGEMELGEAAAGKKLTPALRKVLDSADGMKLLLLTGTPMYNSYREIIFLLSLLLQNDKKGKLSERDVFLPDGRFKPAKDGRASGEELLGAVANAYISFMRGENPLSFPVRLPPPDGELLKEWPTRAPDAAEILEVERQRMLKMPFIGLQYEGDSQKEYQRISEDAIGTRGVNVNSIDEMVQSGNWLFPAEDGVQFRDDGFDACFEDTAGGSGLASYRARGSAPTWLVRDRLGPVSPKAKFVLEKVQNAKGVCFVYSRFIKSGSLPLALALEANGYTAYDREKPLLENGVQDGLGLQCAMCPRREKAHAGAGHKFVPAKYVLITGRSTLSRKNPAMIAAARATNNKDGSQIKVILGSSVASEGVDFRFVREIHVFDAWFHLNKMEQVLGRGIRTCSHALLDPEYRNCTIYLLVNRFVGQDTETADMYMYRGGMKKAMEVGRVTRVLKRYALDCNLNRDAILVTGLATQRHVDSQGRERPEVNVNDTPFTNLCDWIETCDYTCAKPVKINEEDLDVTTYDQYAVGWREAQLRQALKTLFETPRQRIGRDGRPRAVVGEQPFFRIEDIYTMFESVPPFAVSGLLTDILGNQSFRIKVGAQEGYIVYRNGFFLFQPDYLKDIRIPLALRVADMPVRRDIVEPRSLATPITVRPATAPAAAAAVPDAAVPDAVAAQPEATPGSLAKLWTATRTWATEILEGRARKEDIPDPVKEAVRGRFVGDEITRQMEQFIMFNWLYEVMAEKEEYRTILSKVLLEFVWDEVLKANEQMALLKSGGDEAAVRSIAAEQIVKRGEREAFRYVDVLSGALKYVCSDGACSEAVSRVFDTDPADPLNSLKANTETTSPIYGFLVPKAKEGRLVFKTADKVPAPGGEVLKGGECAIVSNIGQHIRMLKEIGEILVSLGYPVFILTEEILEEKSRIKKEKDSAKASGQKYTASKKNPLRSFENSIRACALKDIILRWLEHMERGRGGAGGAAGGAGAGKHYFFRPVAALKVGHKGTVVKPAKAGRK